MIDMKFWKKEPVKMVVYDEDVLKAKLCIIENNRLKDKCFRIGDRVKIDRTKFVKYSFSPHINNIIGDLSLIPSCDNVHDIQAIVMVEERGYAYIYVNNRHSNRQSGGVKELNGKKYEEVTISEVIDHWYVMVPFEALIGVPKDIVVSCRS